MILKIKKFVSVVVILSMVINLIQPITYANDEGSSTVTDEVETTSFSSTPPEVNIQYLGATPTNPMAGQEFTLKYQINPQPFYAGTNEIQGVLDEIAQELEKQYSISLSLNLTLDSSFRLKDGTKLEVNPIEYTLGEDGWYTASSQTIEITMTTNKEGEYSIFKEASLSYKDVTGNDKTILINSPTISIQPYDENQKDLLTVDFKFVPQNALIGDTVEAVVTMIPPIGNNEYYDAKVWLNYNAAYNANLENVGSNEIYIGDIKDLNIRSSRYNLTVKDAEQETRTLTANYSYGASNNGQWNGFHSQSVSANLNVRRGKISVKVLDELGQNITEHTSININLSNKVAQFVDGTYIFDAVPTGNYFLTLSELPEGCSIESGQEKVNVSVNYDENIAEYTFRVKGRMSSPIRVLEIEPADSFILTNQVERVTTGVETTKVTVQGTNYPIEIHHMTMSEFIAKTTKINGYYDVVVIGNWVDNTISADNKVTFNSYQNLENDITTRKSEEIKDFIESGQLVFVDSTIKNLSQMKLVDNFGDNGLWNIKKDNFIDTLSLSDRSLNISAIIEQYINLDSDYKRPVIHATVSEGDDFEVELGDREKRKMTFNLATDLTPDEDLEIQLYLDINGDGLFKDEEKVDLLSKEKMIKDEIVYYEVTYDFYQDYPEFVGLLDWKIEVFKSSIKDGNEKVIGYDVGNILFRRLGEKRVINVLQIAQYPVDKLNDDNLGNLNLSENERFQQLLDSSEVQDYIVNIDVISHQQFYGEKYSIFEGKEDLKDSKYDMVIIGFRDNWQENIFHSIINNEPTDNMEAINQLKEFIQSGQSIMFTHDTMYTDTNTNLTDKWSSFALTRHFRDIIGQSRYWDPNNPSELDLDGESLITHDLAGPKNYQDYEKGMTTWRLYEHRSSSETKTVYQINKSLITSYPFQIGETTSIRTTHGQYFQLNLEDEDVVPWFTLINDSYRNKINQYDALNSYYTYSKGNITFSGTGHNLENEYYPDSELKLFINTIIKAERGANHAPVIESSLLLNQDNYIFKNVDMFNFSVTVKDVDEDKLDVEVNLYTQDPTLNSNVEAQNLLKKKSVDSGQTFEIEAPNKGQEMYVEVIATDEHGVSTTKVYKVVPREDVLAYTVSGNKGLVGEELSLMIQFSGDLSDSTTFQINTDNLSGIEFLEESATEPKPVQKESISYKIKGTREVEGYVTGTIIYSSGLKQEVKIPVSIAEPKITVIIEDEAMSLNSELNVQLSKNGSQLSTASIKTNVNFTDGLTSGTGYEVELIGELPPGISIISTKIKDVKNNKDATVINLSYDSPVYEYTFKVGSALESNVQHGIFKGFTTSDVLEVNEGIDENQLKSFAKDSIVTFGVIVDANEENMTLKLQKDSEGELVKAPQIYSFKDETKSDLNEEDLKLCKIDEGRNFECYLNDKGSYLVLYEYRLSLSQNIEQHIYENDVTLTSEVTQKNQKVRVKTSSSLSLPNLF